MRYDVYVIKKGKKFLDSLSSDYSYSTKITDAVLLTYGEAVNSVELDEGETIQPVVMCEVE